MMRKNRRIFAILTLLVLFIISCNFVAATATPNLPVTVIVEPTSSSQDSVLQSEAEVPRIPVEEALAALQSGAAVIVDVRSTQAYDVSHIAGALSIPLAEIETNVNGLSLEKDQWIITYCT